MWVPTLGEVGIRGRDGNPDRQRATVVLRGGSSESASDESTDGKERGESDHPDAMRMSRDSWEGDVH